MARRSEVLDLAVEGKGKKKSRKGLIVGIAMLGVIPVIGSTLAASITLNTSAIEFGQGQVAVTACDDFTVELVSAYASGAFELDKLVQIMKNNEKLIIFVKSHTDNRGTDEFNLLLSDKRVKATIQYVISNGIDPNRISGKGFGETEPKVDCKENCTEEAHEQNRRSEFVIVKK